MHITWKEILCGSLDAGVYETGQPLPPVPEGATVYYVCSLPLMTVQREILLQWLSDALKFPDYYGQNWDAAFDCLTDQNWEEGSIIVLELCVLPDATVDMTSLKTLVSLMEDVTLFWHAKQVAFYFLFQGIGSDR